MKKAVIKTERLTLVALEEKHLAAAHEYLSDRENAKLMVFLPTESLKETKEYILKAEAEWKKETPDFLEFAVFFGESHVGGITVYFLNGGKTAELGWILGKKHQRQGLITEAALAVMEYIKSTLGIFHVIAQCDSENEASKRVMEKIGLSLTNTEGKRKNRLSDEERTEYTYEVHFSLS